MAKWENQWLSLEGLPSRGGDLFHADLHGPIGDSGSIALVSFPWGTGWTGFDFPWGVLLVVSIQENTSASPFPWVQLWSHLPLSLGLLHGLLSWVLCIYWPCFFFVYFPLCSWCTVNKTVLKTLQLDPCLKPSCSPGKVVNSSLSQALDNHSSLWLESMDLLHSSYFLKCLLFT